MASTATLTIRLDSRTAERDARRIEGALKAVGLEASRTERRTGGLRDEFGRFTAANDNLGLAFRRQFRSVTTLVGGYLSLQAAIRGVGGAVQIYTGFQAQISGVGAVSRASAEEMGQLTEQAKLLGETTKFSASQAAEGQEFLARAGFKVQETIGALPGVLDLAAAGNIDLGRAADIASNILSGFGESADQAGRAADVIALTTASANTNVEQMGEAMKLAAPIAASVGHTLEETAAAVGVLGNAGLQGSLAGTGLRGVLLALVSPTKAARAAIKDLGLEVSELNPETNSLVEIVRKLDEAGLSAAQSAQIFGRRQAAAINVLVENVDELENLTGELIGAEGAASRMATTMVDNVQGDALAAKSAVEGLAISFGEGLSPALRTSLQDFRDWALGSSEAANEVGKAAGFMLENLDHIVIVVGSLIAMGLASWLGTAATAALAAGGGMSAFLASISPVTAGAVALSVALLELNNRMSETSGRLQNEINSITSSSVVMRDSLARVDEALDSGSTQKIQAEIARVGKAMEEASQRSGELKVEVAALQREVDNFEGRGLSPGDDLAALNKLKERLADLRGEQQQATIDAGKFREQLARLREGETWVKALDKSVREFGASISDAGDETGNTHRQLEKLSESILRVRRARTEIKGLVSDLAEVGKELAASADWAPVLQAGFRVDTTFMERISALQGEQLRLKRDLNVLQEQGVQAVEREAEIRRLTVGLTEDQAAQVRALVEQNAALSSELATGMKKGADEGASAWGDAMNQIASLSDDASARMAANLVNAFLDAYDQIREGWKQLQQSQTGQSATQSAVGAYQQASGGQGQQGGSVDGNNVSTAAAVSGWLAIFVAIYEVGTALLDEAKARKYGPPVTSSFDISRGGFQGQAIAFGGGGDTNAQTNLEAQKLNAQMRDAVNELRTIMGGLVDFLPELSIEARNNGEEFRVSVGGMLIGVFDSVEDAIEQGVKMQLARGTFDSLGENVQTALSRASGAVDLSDLAEWLDLARKLDLQGVAAGARGTVRAMEDLRVRFEILQQKTRAMGGDLDALVSLRNEELLAIRRSITDGFDSLLGGYQQQVRSVLDLVASARAYNDQLVLEQSHREKLADAESARFDDLRDALGDLGDDISDFWTAGGGGTDTGRRAMVAFSEAAGEAAEAVERIDPQQIANALTAATSQLESSLGQSLLQYVSNEDLRRRVEQANFQLRMLELEAQYAALVALGTLSEQVLGVYRTALDQVQALGPGVVGSTGFSAPSGSHGGAAGRQERRAELRQLLADMEAGITGLALEFREFDSQTAALVEEMRLLSTFSEETIARFEELREEMRAIQATQAFHGLLEGAAQLLKQEAERLGNVEALAEAEEVLAGLEQARRELEIASLRHQTQLLLEMGVLAEDQAQRILGLLGQAEQLLGQEGGPGRGEGPDFGGEVVRQLAQYVPSLAQALELQEVTAFFSGLNQRLLDLGFTERQILEYREEAAHTMAAGLLENLNRYIQDEEVAAQLVELKGRMEIANYHLQLELIRQIGILTEAELAAIADLIDQVEAGFESGAFTPGGGLTAPRPISTPPTASGPLGSGPSELDRIRDQINDWIAELQSADLDPITRQIQQMWERFNELRDAAGGAIPQIAELQSLIQAEADRLRSQAFDPIRDALSEIRGGAGNPLLSPQEQFNSLNAEFQEAVARLRGGDLSAASDVASLGLELRQFGMSFYGGATGSFRNLSGQIESIFEELLPEGTATGLEHEAEIQASQLSVQEEMRDYLAVLAGDRDRVVQVDFAGEARRRGEERTRFEQDRAQRAEREAAELRRELTLARQVNEEVVRELRELRRSRPHAGGGV